MMDVPVRPSKVPGYDLYIDGYVVSAVIRSRIPGPAILPEIDVHMIHIDKLRFTDNER